MDAPPAFRSAHATDAVACPLCSAKEPQPQLAAGDYEYGLPGRFYVARCNGCGLHYQTPRPPFGDILRYYTNRYVPFGANRDSLVARLKAYFIFGPRLRRYRKLVPPGGRIVDIGCGSGEFLFHFGRLGNWTVSGVEPNAAAAQRGRDLGLDIVTGLLEDAQLPDAAIDLAIMNHVLEHLPDPRATLAEVGRILKPGGHFCGEVPSLACLERTVFGRYWGGYHLPRHLSFFDAQTLGAMLGQAGFTDVRIEPSMQPASWLVSMSNLLRDRAPRLARYNLFSENSFFWLAATTPVAYLLSRLGSGPSIRFLCRKD
jgi:SAM-dependent methyltransferase